MVQRISYCRMISSLPSITKAADAVRHGSLTPIELVEFCLERIRRFEPQVRAWVSVDESGARREAKRLAESARRGEIVGPLHGIPIGIKDIIDVAGWPTKCGSPLREDRIADSDAELVTRLRNAGAIILGKTVTTEFASFDPPLTRNPWNLDRTPGGSSSGSAAAVALEMCLAATGTQTGGSIDRPASYCGVVGLKPTFGSVSLDRIEPLSWHLDHAGPIARCVEDAAIMFQIMSHHSPPPMSQATSPSLTRLSGFFDEIADEEIRRAFAVAIERLQKAGVAIDFRSDTPVSFEDILVSHRCVIAVDAAEHHRAAFATSKAKFGPRISSLIEEGLRAAAVDYSAALRHQARIQSELAPLFANRQVLIMPSTTTAAPNRDSTGDPAFNSLWSFTGLPEITIPCGLTSDGLPCGVQFVAAAGNESRLLSAASACEAILGFHARPPILQLNS